MKYMHNPCAECDPSDTCLNCLFGALTAATSGIPLDQLEIYCAAIRGGRAVVLPCKVGDTVYANPIGLTTSYVVTFICISQERPSHLFFCCIGNPDWEFYDDEIGETTFLTPAEAEAAKRERGGENDG
jgi:hypothetical protein